MRIKKGKFAFFRTLINKETAKALKFIPKILSKKEKLILVALCVAIVVSGFFVWRNHWIKTTVAAPAFGGTYTEGIVGEAKNLDKHLARLTGAGLTQIDQNGEVKPDLAESWEIKEDGKLYEFKLRPGYYSFDLANQIISKNMWQGIEVETPSDQIIGFRLR